MRIILELEYRVNIPVMPYGTLNWWQLLHSHLRGGLCDINFLWTAHDLYYMDYKRQLA